MEHLPIDHWVKSQQFTPETHQDVYPAIDPTSKSNSLAGKVVVVIGASQGIGAEGIVPAFVKAGPKGLVLVATGASKLKQVEQEAHKINSSVKTLTVPTDITNEHAVAQLFERVKAEFGHADVLISNAGVVGGGGNIHEEDVAGWWRNFEVNVKGSFLVARSFIAQVPKDAPASIISLTTLSSYQPLPFLSGYMISKLASQQLNSTIAAGYKNITAVNVHPGLQKTQSLQPAFARFDLDSFALVGGTLVWLAADPARSKFLSGRTISINWDVERLVERKDEIVRDNLLVLDLRGKFGSEQFKRN